MSEASEKPPTTPSQRDKRFWWPDVQSSVDSFREFAKEAGVDVEAATEAVLAFHNPYSKPEGT